MIKPPSSTLGLAFLITVICMNVLLFTSTNPNKDILSILTNVVSFYAGRGTQKEKEEEKTPKNDKFITV